MRVYHPKNDPGKKAAHRKACDIPLLERDYSNSPKEGPAKKALNNWVTMGSGGVFLGTAICAATSMVVLTPAVLLVGIATLGTAIASFTGKFLTEKFRTKPCDEKVVEGVTKEDLNNFMGPSIEAFRKICSLVAEVSGPFSNKAESLKDIIEAILKNCADTDPTDIRRIPTFPSHLERIANLLKNYIDLQTNIEYSATIKKSIAGIEKEIADLQVYYVGLFDRLQTNNVNGVELDTEIIKKINERN
jgi:hypothetical protein